MLEWADLSQQTVSHNAKLETRQPVVGRDECDALALPLLFNLLS